ncbi:unnamed protein product [Rotaria sordida]|uniref:Glucuronosyltransferase n=1 Tax=Rotaria sordida TaxID=392033 RepID=A0A818YLU0_9BILA|nr:unnamed protein product [Rotaria sordida]CAF3751811.1 unnamed protein product [Rotaria sordida]
MKVNGVILLCLLAFVPQSFGFNALIITNGVAGHVIPMFELAKGMHDHNITFLTDRLAETYIDFKTYPNLSSFRLIYTNDSIEALVDQKKMAREMSEYFFNHSLLDSLIHFMPRMIQSMNLLLNKIVHTLMMERFDVIIANRFIFGINALCKEANISCVTLTPTVMSSMTNINQPNSHSYLTSKQMSELKYRIYNVAFAVRLLLSVGKKIIPVINLLSKSFPQVPGPFFNTFTFKNIFLTKSKCLNIINVPPTLYPPSDSSPYTRYMGAFVDESSISDIDNELTRWIKSKSNNSIIYVAFGSSALIRFDRMKSLIYGLGEFLFQTTTASVLLAFRNFNYDSYRTILDEMVNVEYKRIFLDEQRVKVENQFLDQKWILRQHRVSLFISHCGMGSVTEGLYFQKLILCLPLCNDQFPNAFMIDQLGVGQSLFVPPSPWKLLLRPNSFHYYTFTASSVTIKLLTMWRNSTYEKAARIMSLEIKHAGGVKRAVEEIEFFVRSNGDLDRYVPFPSTLPFYQRFLLDIIFIYMILPMTIMFCVFMKCCKRPRKEKKD